MRKTGSAKSSRCSKRVETLKMPSAVLMTALVRFLSSEVRSQTSAAAAQRGDEIEVRSQESPKSLTHA